MTAVPYFPVDFAQSPVSDRRDALSTEEQLPEKLGRWDRGDGNADGRWCPSCLIHRARHANELCPVCTDIQAGGGAAA